MTWEGGVTTCLIMANREVKLCPRPSMSPKAYRAENGDRKAKSTKGEYNQSIRLAGVNV